MNLLLLYQEEIAADGTVILHGRRFKQMIQVHQSKVGDEVRVGVVNGLIGYAEVLQIEADHLVIHPHCTMPPPNPIPLTLFRLVEAGYATT